MITIIPQWIVSWSLSTDMPNSFSMRINARNLMEATDWFNKINFGLTQILGVTFNLVDDMQKQEGHFNKEAPVNLPNRSDAVAPNRMK